MMAVSVSNARIGGVALRAPLLQSASRRVICSAARKTTAVKASKESESSMLSESAALLAVSGILAPMFLDTGSAQAIGREYGIFEGQIFSLMHPAIMFFLFGASLYAGYLGLQWRHTRELAQQIKDLKSQRPALAEEAEAPATPSALDQSISELEKVCHLTHNLDDFMFLIFHRSLVYFSHSFSAPAMVVAGAQGAYWPALK